LVTANARASALLDRVSTAAEFDDFARALRQQIAAMHGSLRMPDVIRSRSVPYDALYVAPTVRDLAVKAASMEFKDYVGDRRRLVVLGDPGAGKSTLAGKLAHDVATDAIDPLRGHVPLLIPVREFASALTAGSIRSIHDILESACFKPYHVAPPPDGIEYLLSKEMTLIIVDGIDEFTDDSQRDVFVRLLEGFLHRYPLVRMVITSRTIGYRPAARTVSWSTSPS
jgi:predicted NACHT family NTPase